LGPFNSPTDDRSRQGITSSGIHRSLSTPRHAHSADDIHMARDEDEEAGEGTDEGPSGSGGDDEGGEGDAEGSEGDAEGSEGDAEGSEGDSEGDDEGSEGDDKGSNEDRVDPAPPMPIVTADYPMELDEGGNEDRVALAPPALAGAPGVTADSLMAHRVCLCRGPRGVHHQEPPRLPTLHEAVQRRLDLPGRGVRWPTYFPRRQGTQAFGPTLAEQRERDSSAL